MAANIIIAVLLLAMFVSALASIIRKRKRGGCGCGMCSGCSNCSACKANRKNYL
ncbi:FeoB-associated Cys-rich membrane protein [bacterium]|nr:FeoB-associated Cys-rich membrane protein [bacterium]